MLSNCEHVFHKECVRSYLEAEIENSKCPILCPLPNCKIGFAPREMNTVLSPENMEKYQKHSFL
jgi:hypothetical protein